MRPTHCQRGDVTARRSPFRSATTSADPKAAGSEPFDRAQPAACRPATRPAAIPTRIGRDTAASRSCARPTRPRSARIGRPSPASDSRGSRRFSIRRGHARGTRNIGHQRLRGAPPPIGTAYRIPWPAHSTEDDEADIRAVANESQLRNEARRNGPAIRKAELPFNSRTHTAGSCFLSGRIGDEAAVRRDRRLETRFRSWSVWSSAVLWNGTGRGRTAR